MEKQVALLEHLGFTKLLKLSDDELRKKIGTLRFEEYRATRSVHKLPPPVHAEFTDQSRLFSDVRVGVFARMPDDTIWIRCAPLTAIEVSWLISCGFRNVTARATEFAKYMH